MGKRVPPLSRPQNFFNQMHHPENLIRAKSCKARIKGEFTAGTAKQFSYLIMVRFWQQASYVSGVAKVPLIPTLLPFRYLNTNRIGMTTTLWTLVTASVRGVLSIDRSRLDHDLRDLGLRRQTHGTQNLSVPSVVPR